MALYVSLGLLAACASPQRGANDHPDALLMGTRLADLREAPRTEPNRRPVVAIALGGGGLRGYAHIGVLQALHEAGLEPEIVVGTSIGAVIGAAYASGAAPDQLWQRAQEVPFTSLADVAIVGPGFIKGDALARWTNELVGGLPIEEFPRRFAAVATDLDRAEPIAILHGDAGQAARASAAIPGIFIPVRYAGGELVDGGVAALVPVRAARALGGDIVVAVDIYCHGPRYDSSSSLSTLLRATQVQSCLIAQSEVSEADVVIAPSVAPAAATDASARELARRAGYEAASAAMPALKKVLERAIAGRTPGT